MKNGVIVLILFVFIISPIHAKDIELEPRIGFSTSPFMVGGLFCREWPHLGLVLCFIFKEDFY